MFALSLVVHAWLDDPCLINALAPLIVEEIVVRLLNGPHSLQLLHIVSAGSPSHLRAATGMSPLQYQKQLRLQAARQMMLSQNVDASSAGGLVGYESSSQFSREYSRLFGEPPQRDIKRMRLQ
ncbi:hypothetical protein PSCICO_22160 [Pseudomonas cichorii]|nr:hypothetical protein PSCICO_22160 [Pseudomonas cichorii]